MKDNGERCRGCDPMVLAVTLYLRAMLLRLQTQMVTEQLPAGVIRNQRSGQELTTSETWYSGACSPKPPGKGKESFPGTKLLLDVEAGSGKCGSPTLCRTQSLMMCLLPPERSRIPIWLLISWEFASDYKLQSAREATSLSSCNYRGGSR